MYPEPPWKFKNNIGLHESGFRIRFEPLPTGTRGSSWAFQDAKDKRWMVVVEQVPPGIDKAMQRMLIKKSGKAWIEAQHKLQQEQYRGW